MQLPNIENCQININVHSDVVVAIQIIETTHSCLAGVIMITKDCMHLLGKIAPYAINDAKITAVEYANADIETLAEKFLNLIWIPENAKSVCENYAEYLAGDPEQERSWLVNGKEFFGTESAALWHLVENCPEAFFSETDLRSALPACLDRDSDWVSTYDLEFVAYGYGYPEESLAKLDMVQQLFKELAIETSLETLVPLTHLSEPDAANIQAAL